MVDGRDLVAEEALGGRELALRLGRLPLGEAHEPERSQGVRSQPAPARPDTAHDRPRLLGVDAGGRKMPPVGGDEREGRAREGVARRAPFRIGVLHRSQRRRPRRLEVTGEVERARVTGERGDEDLVRAGLGELDGAPPVLEGLLEAPRRPSRRAPSRRSPARTRRSARVSRQPRGRRARGAGDARRCAGRAWSPPSPPPRRARDDRAAAPPPGPRPTGAASQRLRRGSASSGTGRAVARRDRGRRPPPRAQRRPLEAPGT